ncbi:MAG: hypothetical protein SFW36_14615 [Leptolyngbyaceae cyanobacterium bins.59]|nr:hypothetical protein [Leptolyngbyaceae cyanobacterium bins.59]
MVYVSQQRSESKQEPVNVPVVLSPAVVRAARQIYRVYYEANPDRIQNPIGVAINQYTYRGKLIMTRKPILLPQECFVPFSLIEAPEAA